MMGRYKKKIIIAVVFAVVLLVALWWGGGRALSSYYYEKGRESYQQNDYDGAKKNFLRSASLNPRSPAPHMLLGRVSLGQATPEKKEYYSHADYQSAIAHYEKALSLGIERFSNFAYAHTLEHLGLSYFYSGKYEKAREVYLKKINRFPNAFYGDQNTSTFWARLLIAEMDFNHLNQPKEALDVLLPLADSGRSDPAELHRAPLLLARLYYYFEDFEKTKKFAELAVQYADEEKNSTEAEIAHNLLALVAGSEKNFSIAEDEIRKANRIARSSGLNNCVLANAQYLGKDYKRAITIAHVAEYINSSYLRSICLHTLARSYSAIGKTTEAREYFKKYLDFSEPAEPKNIFILKNRAEAIEALR